MKQFPKGKGSATLDQSSRVEIEVANVLFPLELKDNCRGDRDSDYRRVYAADPKAHPGIRSIAKLVDIVEDSKDIWLIYEVGSKPLSK